MAQEALAHFWARAMHARREEGLVITFRGCREIRSTGLVVLAGVYRILRSRKVVCRIDVASMDDRVFGLFNSSGCAGFVFTGRTWDSDTLFRHDPLERKDAIIKFLSDQWLALATITMSPDARGDLLSCLWEIYANAFEHGDSDFGVYTCGQRLTERYLVLTVADFGIGIPKNAAARKRREYVPGDEALIWAFTKGESTYGRYARGLGLDMLKEFAIVNDGALEIFSHQGHGRITRQDAIFRNNVLHIAGTIVRITINCDNAHYVLQRELEEQPAESPLF